jgi:predicted amidohydrolase
VDKAESIVRAAAVEGAQLILLQELFEGKCTFKVDHAGASAFT